MLLGLVVGLSTLVVRIQLSVEKEWGYDEMKCVGVE